MEGRVIPDEDDPLFPEVVRRLQTAYPCTKRKMHPQCSRNCEPRSEASLVKDGLLPGPALSCNVFFCKLGSLHVCSETRCDYYGAQPDQTCHVSGIQYKSVVSSYDPNDSRTWRKPVLLLPPPPPPPPPTASRLAETQLPPGLRPGGNSAAGATKLPPGRRPGGKPGGKKKRRIAPPVDELDDLTDKAETIIVNLLFSTMRTQRNMAAVVQNRKKAYEARQTYASEMRTIHKQLPVLAELHRRGAAALMTPLPLAEFPRDDALVRYYVAVIKQLWTKLKTYCTFEHRMDPETVILGTLYMLRQPYVVKETGRVLLAPDRFLAQNLPLINDMIFFGYDRAKITVGMHMLQTLYTSDLAPEALMLDVSLLPERGAETGLIKL